ncbi:alpha/beta-hydrolase [Mycena albidolilacea]|uniref:Alpha/beta-hydrolase n=1 Tax=Mycena albidolilacea TaxID=1033008 RepID=A0AAD6Z709_9AGAR|nr:alpha/beta-hydrolase [Mycena albidolilacea]
MDQNNYKQTKTKRGFNYTYYYSPPAAGSGKPILFFSHGFPSASFLWRKQVAFFQPQGYGIIVPDHLGYGGTDKPTDPKLYVGRGLAEDMTDILDAERVTQVVAIGHDWGSYLVSRFLHYFPQRISACAFFAVGYLAAEGVNTMSLHEQIKQMVGYDALAYQRFFIQPDAAAVIEKNIDSFIHLIYPETPETWRNSLCVDGGARAWIESNKTTALPSYLTPEDKEHLHNVLLSGGLSGPLCWYKASVEEVNLAEDAKLPAAARDIAQPFLYVAFNKDIVALPAFADGSTKKYAKGPVTRKEVDGDHWGVMSHAVELNAILVEWIGGLPGGK